MKLLSATCKDFVLLLGTIRETNCSATAFSCIYNNPCNDGLCEEYKTIYEHNKGNLYVTCEGIDKKFCVENRCSYPSSFEPSTGNCEIDGYVTNSS